MGSTEVNNEELMVFFDGNRKQEIVRVEDFIRDSIKIFKCISPMVNKSNGDRYQSVFHRKIGKMDIYARIYNISDSGDRQSDLTEMKFIFKKDKKSVESKGCMRLGGCSISDVKELLEELKKIEKYTPKDGII